MKKRICILLAALLCLMMNCAAAEGTLSVNGTGESYMTAETAYVSLGVQAHETNVRDAQQKVNAGIEQIIAALTENGIAREDINTDNINIYMYSDYTGQGDERTLYSASSVITVRIADPDGAGNVIDLAFGVGANMLNGISFGAENTEEAEKDALVRAMDDARFKAETLAAAAGMRLGDIVSITEDNVYSYDSGSNYFSMAKEEAAADGATVVHAAELCVSARVTVVWKLIKE